MSFFDILHNEIVIVSIAALIVAQVIKVFSNLIVHKEWSAERLLGDGGMPSAHSATVTAAALMVGITEGFASTIFGLALILAIIVMHDASGVRYEAGKHASTIMEIIDIFNEYIDYISEFDRKIRSEKLKTLVGHTKLQVFFGMVTGICVTLIYVFLKAKGIINI